MCFDRVDGTTDWASKFPELYFDGHGSTAWCKANIEVPEDAMPRFFWPRTAPFACQDLEDDEVQRLQREGIVNPVRTSQWVALLHGSGVEKKYWEIRLCGDFN